jgi:hypothetical protein
MTTKVWRTAVHVLLISLGLSACSEQESLCKEAMKMRSDQLKVTDATRTKFLDQCRSRGMAYTTEQWECLITRMQQREAYEKAMATCLPE